MVKKTNNGKAGGLLQGKSHKQGGMAAIVVNNGKPIEVESGEAIIKKEAVKKHWKQLSLINESEGGNPIVNPEAIQQDKFLFGGIINADDDTLLKAKKMAIDEVPMVEIFKQTGWYVNPFDKMWRYEIDDSKCDFIADIDNIREAVKGGGKKTAKLSDVFEHKELYEKYPTFKDIEVDFVDNEKGSIMNIAIYTNKKKVVIQHNVNHEKEKETFRHINRQSFGEGEGNARRALYCHELSHVLQVRHGFARGTELDKAAESEEEIKEAIKKSLMYAGEIESKEVEKRLNLNKRWRLYNLPYLQFDKNVKIIVEYEDKIEFKDGGNISDLYSKWSELVNMSAGELQKFYDSPEGKQAGLSREEAKKEGVKSGRESARWIIKMKVTTKDKWTPTMEKWANRQISFISRMRGIDGPLYNEDGTKTRKHLALLIWGHNPEKVDKAGCGCNVMEDGGTIENNNDNMNPELEKAKSDLAKAEKQQDLMKKANAIIRSNKDVINKLVEIGFTQAQAEKIQQPDFAGRIGFAQYQLTNNNAYIKRLQDKVNMLDKKQEGAKKGGEKYTFDGGEIEVNYDLDRVQIMFPNEGRVEKELYMKLRKNGWVFSPTNKAFQRKLTPQAISNAVYLFNATKVGGEGQQTPMADDKPMDYEKMLNTRNFTYVTGSIYGAKLEMYQGEKTFRLVYFDLITPNIIAEVKKYVTDNIPQLKLEDVKVNTYPKTYVKEAKQLFDAGAYLPSNNPAKIVLGAFYHNLTNYFKFADAELQKGIEVEKEHDVTLQNVAEGKITPEEAIVETAQEHIKEDPQYYEKVEEVIEPKENTKTNDTFTFLADSPMQQGKALKALSQKIRDNNTVIPLYEWVEKLPSGLKVGTSNIHSSRSEKGVVEKMVIGNYIVHFKAEQDYYNYLQAGGKKYSEHLAEEKKKADELQAKRDAEREVEAKKREEGNKARALEDRARKLENIKGVILTGINKDAETYLEHLNSHLEQLKRSKNIEPWRIEQAEQRIKNTITIDIPTYNKMATELYEIKDGAVVEKYKWAVGDKVLTMPAHKPGLENLQEVEILEVRPAPFIGALEGDLQYKVGPIDGNQYRSYGSFFPIKITEETIIEPNAPEDFDEAILSNINPSDDWKGHLIKERDVKKQIYDQLNGPEEEKEKEVERLFLLYANRFSGELYKEKQQPIKTKREIFKESIKASEDWKQFIGEGGDNRFYKTFGFTKEQTKDARDITDIAIKEDIISRTDGGYNFILSVRDIDTARSIDEEYKKLTEPKDEIGDPSKYTTEQLKKFLDMLKIKSVGRVVGDAIGVEKAIKEELKKRYEAMPLDDLIELQKSKYGNVDIESPMSEDEKILKSAIANKFSDIQTEIKEKRDAKKAEQEAQQTTSDDSEILSKYPKLTNKQVKDIYEKVKIITTYKASLTPEDVYTLEQYEGLGSQTQTGVIDKGLLHQFYTPYIICKKMFDLAYHYGFNGGNVLEPSMGTGRFFKFAPTNANLYGFDPDKTNMEIVKKLYPNANVYNEAFETAFLEAPRYNKMARKSWLPEMDLVIGNPPYGEYMGYYKTFMPSIFKRFEFLFIYLGLKALKKDGLLIFIVSQNFMNNGAMYNGMKAKILEIGTFVDAIRMPNGIFSTTDVGSDVILIRKK